MLRIIMASSPAWGFSCAALGNWASGAKGARRLYSRGTALPRGSCSGRWAFAGANFFEFANSIPVPSVRFYVPNFCRTSIRACPLRRVMHWCCTCFAGLDSWPTDFTKKTARWWIASSLIFRSQIGRKNPASSATGRAIRARRIPARMRAGRDRGVGATWGEVFAVRIFTSAPRSSPALQRERGLSLPI